MLSLLLNVIGLCIQKLGQPGHLLSSEFEISILLGAVVCQKGSMGERGNKCSNFNNKDLIKFFKHAMQSLALPEKEELKCSPVAEWFPDLCVTICLWQPGSGGVHPGSQLGAWWHCPGDRSMVCTLALPLPSREASLWPPEPMPNGFIFVYPEFYSCWLISLSCPRNLAASLFVPTIATLS